jgi:hypothetical protein
VALFSFKWICVSYPHLILYMHIAAVAVSHALDTTHFLCTAVNSTLQSNSIFLICIAQRIVYGWCLKLWIASSFAYL